MVTLLICSPNVTRLKRNRVKTAFQERVTDKTLGKKGVKFLSWRWQAVTCDHQLVLLRFSLGGNVHFCHLGEKI